MYMDTIIKELPIEVSDSNGCACTYGLYLCTIGHWNVCWNVRYLVKTTSLFFLSFFKHMDTRSNGRMNCTNLNLTALIFLHFLDALRKK